jgi:hypothetical protein
VILIDSAFAFDLPPVSAGRVEVVDVETGQARTISRKSFRQLGARAKGWQDAVRNQAKAHNLDVVTIGVDQAAADLELSEFVVERRLRKTKA